MGLFCKIVFYHGLFLILLSGSTFDSLAQVLINYDQGVKENSADSWFRQNESVSALVDINQFPDASWRIRVPERTGLFFNKVLWEYFNSDTVLIVSNQTMAPFVDNDRMLKVTAFKPGILPEEFSIKKGYFNTIIESSPSASGLNKRKIDAINDFFFIALIAVLFFVAIFRAFFPVIFGIFWNPKTVFSFEDIWESVSFSKIYSAELLFYLVLINMGTSLLIVLVIHGSGIDIFGMGLNPEIEKLVFAWLIISLILTIATFIKFIWLGIGAFLFDLSKIAFPHFFYLLKVRGFGLLMVTAFLVLIYSNNLFSPAEQFSYMYYTFFIVYSFGIIGLSIWLYKKKGFNNYHLFSYLCTSELIPFLVICKLLLV
jgi:hypothetical protein